MSTRLILQGGGMAEPVEIEAPAGGKLIDPVRELARDGRLPLYWRCGQGTCGACLVYLEHARSGEALPLQLSGKERNVLIRKGVLNADLPIADTPATPRLACHADLPEGWLKVRW